MPLERCFVKTVGFLLLCVLTGVQGLCSDCSTVGTVSCSGDGACTCRDGFAGRLCSEECGCDVLGSASSSCSKEGVCQCLPRVGGDKCGECSLGYRFLDRGCLSCPPCFNSIPEKYTMALELYQLLEAQINFTLAGESVGVSPSLLNMLMEYRQLLEELLQRINAALIREESLFSEEEGLSSSTSQLRGRVERYRVMVVSAERDLAALVQRVSNRSLAYEELRMEVEELRSEELELLRLARDSALSLNTELFSKLQRLEEIASIANRTSFSHAQEASHLLNQIQVILSRAHLAVQLLQDIASLQSRSIQILGSLELLQDYLEDLSATGQDTLLNISYSVPLALNEASKSLAQVQALSPLDLNLSSISNTLNNLRVETGSARASADASVSNLQYLNNEFITLHELASLLLNRSRSVDREAGILLERARQYFEQARSGVAEANNIINQTGFLLEAVKSNLRDTDTLQEGLQSIIDNVGRAESESADVAFNINRERMHLQQLEADLMTVIEILERASKNLEETAKLSAELNTSASNLARNSTLLSNGSAGLSQEVSAVRKGALELQQKVKEDEEAIANVVTTANRTLLVSGSVEERVKTTNMILRNLTQELNATSLISSRRLQQVETVLVALEESAASNQVEVDILTEKVRRLQESSEALTRSYTSLRQHRDLLQKMLNNMANLNCTAQFLS